MQLAPLLPKNASDTSQTPQQSAGGLDWITIAVFLVLFGGTIRAFVYLTLPSSDPVDLGVQTLEMQKENFSVLVDVVILRQNFFEENHMYSKPVLLFWILLRTKIVLNVPITQTSNFQSVLWQTKQYWNRDHTITANLVKINEYINLYT